jgi:hypothetical protein
MIGTKKEIQFLEAQILREKKLAVISPTEEMRTERFKTAEMYESIKKKLEADYGETKQG